MGIFKTMIKFMINFGLKVVLFPIIFWIKFVRPQRIFIPIMKIANKFEPTSYFLYKQISKDLTRPITPSERNDVAIVIQGPICYRGDFTANTIKRYRQLYPRILIIVSTWKGEANTEFIKEVDRYSISLVETVKPENGGVGNINLQLVSTMAGIKKAMLGKSVKYILKTRSDQIFFRNNFVDLLVNLLQQYPVSADSDKVLKERLIFLSAENTVKYVPFHLSDFMLFGKACDVERFYDVPKDNHSLEFVKDMNWSTWENVKATICKYELSNNVDIYSLVKDMNHYILNNMCPEIYIALHFYLKNINFINISKDTDLINLYWVFLQEYCLIIDCEQVMFYWHKYERQYKEPNHIEMWGTLDFSEWLNIFLNYNHVEKRMK